MNTGRTLALVASISLAYLSAGCAQKAPPAPAAAPPPPAAASYLKPVASLLEIMEGVVEPTSKFVWDSVGSESTPKGGTIDKQPRTDAEWKAVRLQALALAEAANLLVMDGRVVGHQGEKLRDAPGPGDYTPERAQQEIAANRDTFAAFARALQDSAMAVVTSTEKRDVDGLTEAGGTIDEACEQCHKRFWYPEAAAADAEPPRATPATENSASPAAKK
jgi:cytochrome c556